MKRGDLDRQIEKIKLFAIDHNVQNLCILSDIGSGLNDNRRKLQKLLSMVQNGEVNRIFINYKDRLTRFGFNYIKRICDFHDVQIIIVSEEIDHKSDSEELAEDIIALIHSFSGKLYGYDKPVRLPRYLDKDDYQVIVYEKGALSFKEAGFIKLSKTSIKIKTSIPREQITNVRIVPKGNHFIIEVLYDVEKPSVDENDFSRVAFIDPGMNNLMTVTSNVFSPILYNGRPAKAINQLYNKDRAKIQSRLPFRKPAVDAPSYRQVNAVLKPYQTKTSKLLQGITKNRNYRIHDLFHKITTHLVNHLVENDVKVLIFGHNVGQKQDINLGSKTNQNFVSLPFTKLISMLQYKCERLGIHFIVTEESHTSKCSFLDLESIEHHDDYVGRRVKRGLFKSANGTQINADINGSLNIGRKYLTSVNQYSDRLHSELVAHMSNPRRLNIVLN